MFSSLVHLTWKIVSKKKSPRDPQNTSTENFSILIPCMTLILSICLDPDCWGCSSPVPNNSRSPFSTQPPIVLLTSETFDFFLLQFQLHFSLFLFTNFSALFYVFQMFDFSFKVVAYAWYLLEIQAHERGAHTEAPMFLTKLWKNICCL